MYKVKVKLIMTAILEVEVDQEKMFDPDDFEEEDIPTINDSIKGVVESYIDNPIAFVDDESVKINIRHEVIGEIQKCKIKAEIMN